MSVYEDLQKDLIESSRIIGRKISNPDRRDNLKIIFGELQRLPDKSYSDETVIKLIKKLLKSENIMIETKNEKTLYGPGIYQNTFAGILKKYIPEEAEEDEIRDWIKENIDFSQFKNKMQAMKPIMQNFAGRIDGKIVKEILGDF